MAPSPDMPDRGVPLAGIYIHIYKIQFSNPMQILDFDKTIDKFYLSSEMIHLIKNSLIDPRKR